MCFTYKLILPQEDDWQQWGRDVPIQGAHYDYVGVRHHAQFYVGLKMEHRAWGSMESWGESTSSHFPCPHSCPCDPTQRPSPEALTGCLREQPLALINCHLRAEATVLGKDVVAEMGRVREAWHLFPGHLPS